MRLAAIAANAPATTAIPEMVGVASTTSIIDDINGHGVFPICAGQRRRRAAPAPACPASPCPHRNGRAAAYVPPVRD